MRQLLIENGIERMQEAFVANEKYKHLHYKGHHFKCLPFKFETLKFFTINALLLQQSFIDYQCQ